MAGSVYPTSALFLPDVISCPVCGQAHADITLEPGTAAICVRCGSRIAKSTPVSLHLTAALALAALILYLPAMTFPILDLSLYGRRTSNTVWDGVVTFYNDGDYFLSAIVLLASIVIPVLKLAGLFFLVITSRLRVRWGMRLRTLVYRFIDSIGRWAMLDVFVLSIWVAVVKLRTVGDVTPGDGLLPFAGVVILTLLASACFDPQLIWAERAGRPRMEGNAVV